MQRGRLNQGVLLGLVVLITLCFLLMIKQFLMPLFMAGLFTAMVSPLYKKLVPLLKGRTHLASGIIVLGVLLLVIGPLTALIMIMIPQAIRVGQSVTPWVQQFITEPTIVGKYLEKIPLYDQVLPYRDEIIQKIGELVAVLSSKLIESLSAAAEMTMSAVIGTIIMLYVMFYFLSMGDLLLKKILYFLPLHHDDEEKLLNRFTSVARATIKGTIIIGIMQGSICGVSFWMGGIEGAVFWGAVMAVASVIPAFGTAIIWVPAIIVLALMGKIYGVIVLAVGCGLIAGNLDNLVRPRLVGKDTEMHDLFVLFGTLGGISMFGLLGIILGPILAALFITIWEIYGYTFADHLPEVGNIGKKQDRIDVSVQENTK